MPRAQRRSFATPLGAILVALLVFSGYGQRLPLRKFTAADGLAQDNVNRIVRDSRGFLWFCTSDGLSRFDGSQFKNYTQQHGLPHRNINDLLETSDGVYLVASSAGVSVFDPYGAPVGWDVLHDAPEDPNVDAPLVRTFLPPEDPNMRSWSVVNSLAQQPDTAIYAATNNGLFKFTGGGRDWRFEKVEYDGWLEKEFVVNELLTDTSGGVWVAAASG